MATSSNPDETAMITETAETAEAETALTTTNKVNKNLY
jgi:hypothetical protein